MRRVLSPEAQLLLAAGATGPAADEAMRALLARPLDWERVILLANREKAAPVLVRRLGALRDAGVPADALTQLRRIAMVVEFKMLHLRQRLEESLAALEGAGIRPVLLKGAALASTRYGSFAERPMGDLDLLVTADEAPRAREVLLGAGWVWNEAVRSDADYVGHHHLPPLEDRGGGSAKLEIHTELFIGGHPFRLSSEVVRREALEVRAGGRTVRVPSALHTLLHTCLHFAWSHNMRLSSWRAFRDVATVTAGDFPWAAFVQLARENRAGTCCYWTLRLARGLTGLAVPAFVLEALRPPLAEFLAARLERHFITQLFPTEPDCPSVAFDKLMWGAGVMPRWSGHGASRPWDEADPQLERRRAQRPTSSSRAVRHLRNLERWSRYVRAVLAPAPAQAE